MNLNNSIKTMTNEITSILADNAPSIYLYGSVAIDDFKQGWSDIDIIVLTQKEISQPQAEILVELRQTMLERFPNNPYFRQFEGGMLSLDAFLNKKNERTVYWGTSGQRITDSYFFDSFSMSELLDSGILLYGDDVRGQMTCPTYEQLRDDVARHYQAIRKYAQTTGRSLYSYGWLLDIARCIYTLRTGKIIAKTAGGDWALETGICPVPDALRKAVEVRKAPADYKWQNEVLDFAEKLGADIQRFADILEKELYGGEKHDC